MGRNYTGTSAKVGKPEMKIFRGQESDFKTLGVPSHRGPPQYSEIYLQGL